MRKGLSVLVFGVFSGANCLAASVCTVTQENRVEVRCDGVDVSLDMSASRATDPFTAELDVLLNQGYKIVSSAGGTGGIETILVKQ